MKSLQMLRSARATKIEKNTAIMLLARFLQRIQINLIANLPYGKFNEGRICSFGPFGRQSVSYFLINQAMTAEIRHIRRIPA
jgi:hypothetical protein